MYRKKYPATSSSKFEHVMLDNVSLAVVLAVIIAVTIAMINAVVIAENR